MSGSPPAGRITTLPRLNQTHLATVEAELVELAQRTPIGLVLPCHANDLTQSALAHIVRELSGARFLAEVVLSINGTPRASVPEWAQGLTLLWNDAAASTGKGENVAAAFRHLAANTGCAIFAVQDCDVASFRRHDLARLCYAVAHPQLGFRFAKMYYTRATDRLYGRVSRLLLAPLLSSIERAAGALPLIEFLRSFRYPLAGEVALQRELASELPAQSGWTLELGQLCEVFRRVHAQKVCEVEGGAAYDHRHQPVEPGLARMAAEIVRELFVQLAADGIADTAELRAATLKAYHIEAALAIRNSACVAQINTLPFDEAGERALVTLFAEQLSRIPLSPQPGN